MRFSNLAGNGLLSLGGIGLHFSDDFKSMVMPNTIGVDRLCDNVQLKSTGI